MCVLPPSLKLDCLIQCSLDYNENLAPHSLPFSDAYVFVYIFVCTKLLSHQFQCVALRLLRRPHTRHKSSWYPSHIITSVVEMCPIVLNKR